MAAIGLFPATLEFLEPKLLNDKFHAGLVAILSVPQRIEHFDDGLNRWESIRPSE